MPLLAMAAAAIPPTAARPPITAAMVPALDFGGCCIANKA